MTLAEARRNTEASLKPFVGEDAETEARELLALAAGMDRRELFLHADDPMLREQTDRLTELMSRRMGGEPLQYILGEWEFMGLPFFVSPDVLIPRQDTETVCEAAIRSIRERGYRTVLDLCTGSGCIGIAIRKLTGADVTLADVSEGALAVAARNAERNHADVTIRSGDLFGAVGEGRFDLIVCNPPYLTARDMDELQREVRFEPSGALFGGEDGLVFYRRIARAYRSHLCPGGMLILEIGSTQGEAVCALFAGACIERDYGGNDRAVIVREG